MTSTATDTANAYAAPRYPGHLVALRRLSDGTDVIVRPILPEDDAIEREFIGGLSRDTGYNRLLSGRRLTPDEIRHLTRIDYEREVAFIAITVDRGQRRLLGVARYVRDAGSNGAEFAIVVADAWQHKGVGSLLLRTLLQHAHSAGIERLHGITLATNQAMQNLARKLGFTQQPDPQDATVRQITKPLAAGDPTATARASAGYSAGPAANDEAKAPFNPRQPPAPVNASTERAP
jgi:acetyltransferase